MPRAPSDKRNEPEFPVFTDMIFAAGAMPATPTPLLVPAAMMPAICVA
ncbi:MAG: hypothetical protein WA797_02750 [Acidimicrobiales bacterium]